MHTTTFATDVFNASYDSNFAVDGNSHVLVVDKIGFDPTFASTEHVYGGGHQHARRINF